MTPSELLARFGKDHPNINKQINAVLHQRADGKIEPWPEWCFIPLKQFSEILMQERSLTDDLMGFGIELHRLMTFGKWRFTQGIYRFAPEFLEEIKKTEISGAIPVEVFQRLPEYCVYIETPGMSLCGREMRGFFAHLDYAPAYRTSMLLRLYVHCADDNCYQIPIELREESLQECLEKTNEITDQSRMAFGLDAESNHPSAAELSPLLSLLLYLCSDEPEIDEEWEKGSHPSRPQAKKTKRGLMLMPALRPRTWMVGAEIANALKQVHREAHAGPHRTMRPHIRRGHWHGYWRGPADDQKFFYRWLMPMLINMKK